jgi:hypothetical protein
MLHQPVHMRDQVTNRIQTIMQEHVHARHSIKQLDEFAVFMVLMAGFFLGLSL